jgi:hypothetical protein
VIGLTRPGAGCRAVLRGVPRVRVRGGAPRLLQGAAGGWRAIRAMCSIHAFSKELRVWVRFTRHGSRLSDGVGSFCARSSFSECIRMRVSKAPLGSDVLTEKLQRARCSCIDDRYRCSLCSLFQRTCASTSPPSQAASDVILSQARGECRARVSVAGCERWL